MTKDELKKKCTERAKIFQQAMESCHSSNPIDCIEWFADRIAELEQKLEQIKIEKFDKSLSQIKHDREVVIEYNERLQKENAELQDKLKNLESVAEVRLANWQKCKGQLTKAKEIIKTFLGFAETFGYSPSMDKFITEVKDFLKECE